MRKGDRAGPSLNYRWIYVRQVGCAQAFRSGMTGVRMVSFSSWVGGDWVQRSQFPREPSLKGLIHERHP